MGWVAVCELCGWSVEAADPVVLDHLAARHSVRCAARHARCGRRQVLS